MEKEHLCEIKDQLIEDFNNNVMLKDMAEKYSIGCKYLSKFMKDSGFSFKKRTQLVQNNPFEDLSKPEVMYWLGMMASDGGIFDDRVSIQLARVDIELLEKYKTFLGGGPRVALATWKLNGKEFEGCSVKFRNKLVVEHLNNLGITPNKSFTLNPNFVIDGNFMRGYIDGDGSYDNKFIEDRKVCRIRVFTASNMMASKIIEFYFKNDLYFRYYKLGQRKRLHEIVVSKKEDVLKLLDILYNNADIYLERKYQKAVQMRNDLDNNTLNSGN